ncbi:MAG: cellulase family glycosylhydrolase [Alphaproteobacteria bacterium]|nr:cellulase family glycosylhydrolase [Alphaproteobacteria bacterium]
MDRLTIKGNRFVDGAGRSVMLRGVNLGGDCKVPFPNGGTNYPSDFSDHRTVSFVGRPFPLSEADEHFTRLKSWGMNCLRLLTTWEAVEHEEPEKYDTAYLDYFAEIARRAGDHGLYVFIDFHQDVWSRMSGGDGAPGWTFEAVGLDFTKFHASGAAHVMQHKYDYARGGRQEDRYPMMTWANNYRMPANAIMWTLFFAGDLFVPGFKIEGRSAQDYLQGHYLGAMREIAKRVKSMPHVLGFDTLNEPGTGWIGQALSYRHVERSAENPDPVRPGPAWSVLDGLLVAQGQPRTIPELAFDPAKMKVGNVGEKEVNAGRVSIWREGVSCPFEAAGAYRVTGNGHEVLREDFFEVVKGKMIDVDADGMAPFFQRVAREIREINSDWLIFAELDPFRAGEGFPPGTPERTVNASHWYDIVTLVTKAFMFPTSLNPFTMKTLSGAPEIEGHYANQLGRIKEASKSIPGGAPTLIGEFGIPFDLDGAAAYQAWAKGDCSAAPWEKHVTALDLMYNAMDRHLLNCTLWNYTASNRNDVSCGDGWNQEDLSVFSRDQLANNQDINSGGRAVEGFVRPFVRECQGVLKVMSFDRASGEFTFTFDADPMIDAATEIYLPTVQYPEAFAISAPGLQVEPSETSPCVSLRATKSGEHKVTIRRAS